MDKADQLVTTASFKFDEDGGVRVENAALSEIQVMMWLQRQDRNRLKEFQQKALSIEECLV